MLHASGLFPGFIGDSSPHASVEGARRPPCKVESCTTTAGFVWEAVKRLWACYKPLLGEVLYRWMG
jgi:hypothetical protein